MFCSRGNTEPTPESPFPDREKVHRKKDRENLLGKRFVCLPNGFSLFDF